MVREWRMALGMRGTYYQRRTRKAWPAGWRADPGRRPPSAILAGCWPKLLAEMYSGRTRMLSNLRTLVIALATVACLTLAGCGGNKTKELIGNADKLYDAAKRASDNGNYRDA